MTFPDLAWLPFVLLAGLALPRARDARLAGAGVLVVSLAVASAGLVLGDGTADAVAARAVARGVGGSYLTVNATLLLVGFGLVTLALVGDRGESRPLRTVAVALLLLGVVAWATPLLALARLPVAIPAAISVVLALLAFGVWAGERGGAPDAAPRAWVRRGRAPLAWGMAGAVLLGAAVPNLGVALLLAATALALAWLAAPVRHGLARLPIAPVASGVLVLVAALAWRAAGPDGLAYAGIGDAAFSPRLQQLLTVVLVPALFVLAGVPPFDRLVPGAALAPLAAVLTARGVAPGFAEGVLHWRSAAALWLVLGAADGVRRERWGPVLACASLFALLVGEEGARASGLALGALAALAELAPLLATRLPRGAARAATALALAAGALGLRATLAEEVVYSVAFVAVVAAGVLRGAGRPAPAAPAG